ncbi:hypothetical protein PG989_002779 [Apiospora arundinis]
MTEQIIHSDSPALLRTALQLLGSPDVFSKSQDKRVILSKFPKQKLKDPKLAPDFNEARNQHSRKWEWSRLEASETSGSAQAIRGSFDAIRNQNQIVKYRKDMSDTELKQSAEMLAAWYARILSTKDEVH